MTSPDEGNHITVMILNHRKIVLDVVYKFLKNFNFFWGGLETVGEKENGQRCEVIMTSFSGFG